MLKLYLVGILIYMSAYAMKPHLCIWVPMCALCMVCVESILYYVDMRQTNWGQIIVMSVKVMYSGNKYYLVFYKSLSLLLVLQICIEGIAMIK